MTKLILLSASMAALLLAGGCSKKAGTQAPVSPEQGTYQAPPDESTFGEAWDGITGAAGAAGGAIVRAGEWTFSKAKDGAIVVGRGVKRVAGKASEETNDSLILSGIKSRMAASDKVDASDINVDVDEGVVVLRGQVDSRQAAGEAIRLAMDTRGVNEVRSYLTW